jgi:signal transduction histidine kinase
LEEAAREGRAELWGWRVREDGSRFWAHVVINALRDEEGRLRGFGKITRDLTERRRQEQALQLSQDKLQILLDASRVLSESLDYRTTLDALSKIVVPALADWYAVELLEPDGTRAQVVVAHTDPEKVELARSVRAKYPPDPEAEYGVARVLRTGRAELYPEISDDILRATARTDEHYRMLSQLGLKSALVVPLHVRQRVIGAMTLISAESNRGYTQEDIAFAEELARRAAVAVDNARLFGQAQEAIHVRDEFLQIASHELKTPLTPLQLQLDTLVRAVDGSGVAQERLAHKLQTAARQTTRLSRLVETLLDVSRISAGRIELDPERLDLGALVRELVERFRNEARVLGSTIHLSTVQPIYGSWDRLRLEQILSNVLANAVKYGAGQPIEVALTESDGSVRIAVSDHGIGIDSESIGRIFGRFERASSIRHFGGLGLGLFIARQLTEAHGGTILVQSESGSGSTFTILLPTHYSKPAGEALHAEEHQA